MSFELNLNQDKILLSREKIEDEISDFKRLASEKFTGEDLKNINEALDFMLKIHLPQKDRFDGRPFASHPLAVAKRVIGLSDNPELVMAALIHDGVEDQSDHIFAMRLARKYPDRDFIHFEIDENVKEKYKEIFSTWSFREIEDRFGDAVKYYVENMTNHDFNSLAEDLGLEGEEKQDFINRLYIEHVENIMNDPELFTLKLADLSINVDLHSLDPESKKYAKLKRKYKSVIETVLDKLKNIQTSHPLYVNRDDIIEDLTKIYNQQYKTN
jgi:(p)ppGpp synthase/HD superfamily hydrolase